MQRDRRGEPDLLGLIRWARDHNAVSGLGEDLCRAHADGLVSASTLWKYVGPALSERRSALRLYDAPPFRLPVDLDSGDFWVNRADGDVVWLWVSVTEGHVLLVGSTKSGKSGFILHVAIQWPAPDRTITLVDMYKSTFGALVPVWQAAGFPARHLTPATWYTNRFQPPAGCDPRAYLNYLVELDVQLLGLEGVARSEAELRRIYYLEYERCDTFAGATRWPCPLDMHQRICEDPEVHPDSRAALQSRSAAVLSASKDPQRRTRRAETLGDLMDAGNTVMDLGPLSDQAKKYHLVPQVYGVMLAELARPAPSRVRRLLVLDDAQAFLAADQGLRRRGLSGFDELLGQVRVATSVMLGVQTVQRDVSPHLLANTRWKVMFSQATARDLALLAADLQCSPEETAWAARHLVPGRAVTRLPEGPCHWPFVLRYPYLRLPSPSGESLLDDAGPASCVVETAAEYASWEPYRPQVSGTPRTPKSSASGVSPVARWLLQTLGVAGARGLTMSQAAELAKGRLNGERLAAARAELEACQFISSAKIKVHTKGREAILMIITPEGVAALAARPSKGGA